MKTTRALNLTPNFVGELVHYHPDGAAEPFAAVVTSVVDPVVGRVWLAVFAPGSSLIEPHVAEFSDEPSPRCWTRRRTH